MKILQFPVAASKGGITQYVLQNWKYIDKEKFQFDFATMSEKLDFADDLERQGCKVFYISCYAEQDEQRFCEEFRAILSEGNYDAVHLHTKQWKSFHVEEIAREVGIKRVIVHSHSTGIDTLDGEKREEETKLHNRMLGQLNEDIATDYWACSRKAADFLYANQIPQEQIKIMNNAIDLSKFRFQPKVRQEYRKMLGVEDNFVIGNVGRFVYPKNQEFLLHVFRQLCELRDDCILLLVGCGEREEEYRKYVKKYGLAKRVIFTGYRTDIPQLLQVMDCFCLPSRFEGLGIAVIEAQASGVSCICSNKVPEEAFISPFVQALPLNEKLWLEELLNTSRKDRSDAWRYVQVAGYDIEEQIKVVEKAYEGR